MSDCSIARRADEISSLLCIALDPDPELLPAEHRSANGVIQFVSEVVQATSPYVCAYKINPAFFEIWGAEGSRMMYSVRSAIPDGIPVIFDGKRGDVPHSARMYARAAFESFAADGVTVSPWLGADAVAPFLEYEGTTFAVTLTSNPGRYSLQRAVSQYGVEMWQQVVEMLDGASLPGRLGYVVGAREPQLVAQARALAPDAMLLMPGIGAQGGALTACLRAGLDASAGNVLVVSGRSILHASSGSDFADAATCAAMKLRERIEHSRSMAVPA